MMYSPELSQALANRHRRRVSVNARKRSLTDHGVSSGASGSGRSLLASTSGSARLSLSGRKSGGFDANGNELETPVPFAVTYLEQVVLEMSVTKKHADVRYVLTVRHNELNEAWRHARSFDEYRKLQQRLIKKLHHGHFCNADCPWLYGFLKSYFPKKLVFTFSSAKVVESRKQTLERFFAALLGFLMDRKNHCCSVVTTGFADELIEFIYGDALQQYGLANPTKSVPASAAGLMGGRKSEGYESRWDDPPTPEKLQQLQEKLLQRDSVTNSSFTGSLPEEDAVNDPNCGDCGICSSSLCGAAYGSSTSTSSLTISLSEDDSSGSGSSRTNSGAGVPLSQSNSGNTNTSNNSGVFNPPWLGTIQNTGSMGSANSFGSSRRSNSSASRRRAATYYLTTLSCGHQFHDECIVPKLNESLKCPTCGRVQTND